MVLDSRGFTLLECIIVCAIIAVFISFTPVFFRVLERQKLHATAHLMVADLRLVQQYSINGDIDYSIHFDPVNDRYLLKKGVYSHKTTYLPGGINLVTTNFNFENSPDNCDHKLRFNLRGEPVRKNGALVGGHVSVCNKYDEFLYVIVASITGRVRVDSKPPSS
ncbi:MAG: prepilin-type N-terminal cleavage/methylation domain-containing protein [Peptococcaceae bacterium]|nr:prepilin-type N-terminal cleavage/methylation domain-containing protein [Candidatus Syntrophopropionicum ammoniitolerans]